MPDWNNFDVFLGEVLNLKPEERQPLVDELLRSRAEWPWVSGNRATFIYTSVAASSVALNLDTIEADPPFDRMIHLEGTTLWYVTREFAPDDLLDYLLAIDDPMTPLATDRDVVNRIASHWRIDPRNPNKLVTAQMSVSVLRMRGARPFPDWAKMHRVPRGKIYDHNFNSQQLQFNNRKVWVYTPAEYDTNHTGSLMYPLLIMQDGQWCMGPLQLPYIADTLIKNGHMEPVIIAMVQSGDQKDRIKTYVSNDKHYQFILLELLPFLQANYRIDSTNLGIGGVAVGAIAAAHAALKNPAVFSHLAMISPPLGKGIAQDQLRAYIERFRDARVLPKRIFQSVGRYETRSRFLLPARALNAVLRERDDVAYQYAEIGSGHGLVAFRSILPETLAWTFPGVDKNEEVGAG